jgi:hypothetical protein
MHSILDLIREWVWSERLKPWLEKRRVGPRMAPLLVAVCVTCVFILTGKPHISVPGDRFVFELPPFRRCSVTFVDPVYIESYVVGYRTKASRPVPGSRKAVDAETLTLTIENPQAQPSATASNEVFVVTVEGVHAVSAEIASVSVDGKPVELRKFDRSNLQGVHQYVRLNYIRTILAELLYKLNDPVSNWVLTFMFVWCLLLFNQVVWVAVAAHLYQDKAFDKYLARSWGIRNLRDKAQRDNNENRCNAEWYSLHRSFHFLQALGPAVGFILTVSSLVGALHPALRSSNNLDAFLTGIHVAMISTFIGLLMRIIALWGERFNNELYDRALLRLPAESEPNPKGGQSI